MLAGWTSPAGGMSHASSVRPRPPRVKPSDTRQPEPDPPVTLIAGIYSRIPGRPVDRASCDALDAALSRHPGESLTVVNDPRCHLVKVDVGAFGVPAQQVDDGGVVTLMTGEPLFAAPSPESRRNRADDARWLHEAAVSRDWSILRTARGVFSAAQFDPRDGRLTLVTDKLAIRPLYVSVTDDSIIFASALRILEHTPAVQRVADLRGVTELTTFGFPLGVRTPYSTIMLLNGGERLVATGPDLVSRAYWRWDDIAPDAESDDTLALRAYRTFSEAVRVRLAGDRETVAFLSGGLDSRAVVVALLALQARVHTFTFARAGTQDQRFSRLIATSLGTEHEEIPRGTERPEWTMLMARAWAASPKRANAAVARPSLVWSGDGGSVALGHVYVRPATAAALAAGDERRAIRTYLAEERITVPRRLLTRDALAVLGDVPYDGVHAELDSIHGADRIRAFHLFLLRNDQRRHLSAHFEALDLHRTEYQLPFLDSDLVSIVMSVPGDRCLRHEFYMKWFALFPAVARSVPWQTYPGHVPCPLPSGDTGYAQWDRASAKKIALGRRRHQVQEARRVLRAGDFPRALLRKRVLRAASMAAGAGFGDYGYVLETAANYFRYWHASHGQHVPLLDNE